MFILSVLGQQLDIFSRESIGESLVNSVVQECDDTCSVESVCCSAVITHRSPSVHDNDPSDFAVLETDEFVITRLENKEDYEPKVYEMIHHDDGFDYYLFDADMKPDITSTFPDFTEDEASECDVPTPVKVLNVSSPFENVINCEVWQLMNVFSSAKMSLKADVGMIRTYSLDCADG